MLLTPPRNKKKKKSELCQTGKEGYRNEKKYESSTHSEIGCNSSYC